MKYKYLFDAAIDFGIDELEININEEKDIVIETNNDQLEKFIISNIKTFKLKGIIKGKVGKCNTEILDEKNYKDVLKQLIANARLIDNGEEDYINNEEYKTIAESDIIVDIDYKKIIDNAISLYIIMKKENESLLNLEVDYDYNYRHIHILNSHGLDEYQEKALVGRSYEINVGREGVVSNHYEFYIDLLASPFDEYNICNKIIKRAIDKLDCKIIESGNYSVILNNNVMCKILGPMIDSFCANNIQQRKSQLVDKLNKQVASTLINIVEEPQNNKFCGFRLFDDEGTKTYNKKIVDNGILKTILYNIRTSHKDGVKSTGNGYSDSNEVSARNFYIMPGIKKLDDELKSFSGVYIINAEGLHVGINRINGDFSLQAEGYEMKNGRIITATKLILISGNFFEMLNNVIDVYDDLIFKSEIVGSPSIKVSNLSISGK